MGRTQIYLEDEELELLVRAEQTSGASRSEPIRRAIRASYGRVGVPERLQLLRQSAGSWQGRDQDGAAYVESIRSDLNQRLERFGL